MFKYSEILKEYKGNYRKIEWARKKVYDFSFKSGNQSETARVFGCSRTTVVKIINEGWQLKSRRPKSSPNKTSDETEELILAARKHKRMGPTNLKVQYELPVSQSTVYRVLQRREKDLEEKYKIKARKRKWQQTKDLREIKKNYKPFEYCSIDGKVLYDIKPFYKYYKTLLIPKIQFTFTCQRTGATFFTYASGETALNACTFVVYGAVVK